MSFADYIKIFELKPRYLFAVWFFGALVLLLPAYITDRFGFTPIINAYRGWIGLATLAVFTLWTIQIWSWHQERQKERKVKSETAAKEAQMEAQARAEILQSLSTLSVGEQRLLLYALYRNRQTVVIKFADQSAQALCAKHLLEPAPQGEVFNYPFTIPNFVWEHLQKHKSELLPSDKIPRFAEWVEGFEHDRDWQRSFDR